MLHGENEGGFEKLNEVENKYATSELGSAKCQERQMNKDQKVSLQDQNMYQQFYLNRMVSSTVKGLTGKKTKYGIPNNVQESKIKVKNRQTKVKSWLYFTDSFSLHPATTDCPPHPGF